MKHIYQAVPVIGAAFVLAFGSSLSAQVPTLPVAQTQQAQQAQQGQQQRVDRAELEQRIRVNTARRMREMLGLDDAQMTRLMATMEQMAPTAAQLFERERATREALRVELEKGNGADQARTAELMTTMLRVQQDRIALVEREQRELAKFLTPTQRARYHFFRENMIRRMDELSEQRLDGQRPGQRGPPAGAGRRGGPPPSPPVVRPPR
jgi:periplasmic protein CpxP/Spy